MCRPPPNQPPRRLGVAALLWPLIVSWPLVLKDRYQYLWPRDWYEDVSPRPRALGLLLGFGAVVWGQIFVLAYQYVRWKGSSVFGALVRIQPNEKRDYAYSEGLATHLAQPEGFVVLGVYLSVTWLMRWMPDSYYSFEGGINWPQVGACLLCQDLVQYLMHVGEHKIHSAIYRASHKPHHRFTNPRLFDAFNGSLADTLLMILVPLLVTKWLIHTNLWTYMTFGTLYANALVLIHSEFHHAWDPLFSFLSIGTAADHHVHHKLFVKNFGHLFMYWDKLLGTYKDPVSVRVFQPKLNEY